MDAVYDRVMQQGWPVETAPVDQFWGERLFNLRYVNGNQLVVVQQIEDAGLEEIRERHRKMLEDERNQTI